MEIKSLKKKQLSQILEAVAPLILSGLCAGVKVEL